MEDSSILFKKINYFAELGRKKELKSV